MNKLTTVDASVVCSTGLVRTSNEDNFYLNGLFMHPYERSQNIRLSYGETCREMIFAVCDGMGGEALGERASLTAVSELKDFHDTIWAGKSCSDITGMLSLMEKYVDKANKSIYRISAQKSVSMGTTLAILLIFDGHSAVLNLGDSRIYLARENSLEQLTVDHTEAERLIRLGILTRHTAKGHKSRSLLSMHLGIPPGEGRIEAYTGCILPLKRDDVFLICSDGLTDMVDDDQIKETIQALGESSYMASSLAQRALQNGGKDNITVITVKIRDIC